MGHISTLHIWPAKRPLAACRAALIATQLHDPGTPEKRKEPLERTGRKMVTYPAPDSFSDGDAGWAQRVAGRHWAPDASRENRAK
jgi:putative DNA methylase